MNDDLSLAAQLAPLMWTDSIVYGCLTAQQIESLSNEQTLIRMVKMMAERNEHTNRVNQALSARVPSYVIGSIGI